jgi:hypothetical protein
MSQKLVGFLFLLLNLFIIYPNGTLFMKQHIFLSLLACVLYPSIIFAQNSNKYVKISNIPNGILFFVQPIELSASRNKLSIDFTYSLHKPKNATDSVTVNFTLISKEVLAAFQALSFMHQQDSIFKSAAPAKLYIEQKKKKWHYRYSTKMSFAHFQKLLVSPSPVGITIHTPNKNFVFYTAKEWENTRKTTADLIKMNE